MPLTSLSWSGTGSLQQHVLPTRREKCQPLSSSGHLNTSVRAEARDQGQILFPTWLRIIVDEGDCTRRVMAIQARPEVLEGDDCNRGEA